MSDTFNNPNFDSRNFDPLKPKIAPGISFEEHQRIVKAAVKHFNLKPKAPADADIRLLLAHARAKIESIRAYAESIDQAVKMSGSDHNREQLHVEILTKYLDGFCQLSKDELLLVLTHFLTQLTMKEIV